MDGLALNAKNLASQAHDIIVDKLNEVDGLTAKLKCEY